MLTKAYFLNHSPQVKSYNMMWNVTGINTHVVHFPCPQNRGVVFSLSVWSARPPPAPPLARHPAQWHLAVCTWLSLCFLVSDMADIVILRTTSYGNLSVCRRTTKSSLPYLESVRTVHVQCAQMQSWGCKTLQRRSWPFHRQHLEF